MGLGRETSSSSSVSLSMLKVSIKEGTTSVNSNHVASNFMVICIRPSPLFFRLASNELPDIGSVSRIEKKKLKKKHKSWNSRPWYPRTTLKVNIYMFGLTRLSRPLV